MSKFRQLALGAALALSALSIPAESVAGLRLQYDGKKNGVFTFSTGWTHTMFAGDKKLGITGQLAPWWRENILNDNFKSIADVAKFFKRPGFNPLTTRAVINAKFGKDMIVVIKPGDPNTDKRGVFKIVAKDGEVLFRRTSAPAANPVPGPIAGAGLPLLVAGAGFLMLRRREASNAAI